MPSALTIGRRDGTIFKESGGALEVRHSEPPGKGILFLLVHRTSTHETQRPLACSRERSEQLRVSHDKEQPTADNVTDLVDQVYDISHCALISLKVASDKVKASYDSLVNSANCQAEEHVWLYHPTRTARKPPNLQISWEERHKMNSQINHTVCRIL
jgi:hypothetical protein